jgi:hypothetical protein
MAGGSGGGRGAASAALGWSALKSGLLGASASGAAFAPALAAGIADFGAGFAAGAGATPIGRICARAGFAATPASAANHKSELERRFISTINLFISNDNPASLKLNTSLLSGSPVAITQQLRSFLPTAFSQTNP